MTRFITTCVATATLVLSLQSAMNAQVVNEVFFEPGSSPADWGTGANWSDYGQGNNVPEGQFDESATINSGSTAQVTVPFPTGTGGEQNGPGALQVLNGTLEIQNAGLLGLSEPASAGSVDRSVTINGVLNIQGGGQLLNASTLTFGSASTYDLDITGSTTSPIQVDGLAVLNGALDLDFTGVSPVGTRTLLSAGSTSGAFSSITTTGLAPAQTLSVLSDGGVVTATVANVPTLTINRQTGVATIENTHGTGISLDGYSLRSALGAFDPIHFDGLPRSGWDPALSNSTTAVAEGYEGPNLGSPSDSLPSNTPYQVGNAGFFSTPAPNAFLQETEDVIFEITDPSLGSGPIRGVVNYVGDKVINNNIVLTINSSGEAVMLNQSPFPQNIEVYRVTSSGSPLQTDTWTPLADQTGLDNDSWQVSAQSNSTMLLELTEEGSSLFSGITLYELGQILDSGFTEDFITFEFLLAGESQFRTGGVIFGDLPEVAARPGDYNNDGAVDAIDYAVWRENLGATEDGSVLNGNGNGGVVDSTDFDLWKSTFGAVYSGAALSGGATPTPEPNSIALTAFLMAASLWLSRRRSI